MVLDKTGGQFSVHQVEVILVLIFEISTCVIDTMLLPQTYELLILILECFHMLLT